MWKTAFRGTPRDFRFLQRLRHYPTLAEVLLNANIRKGIDRSYGVTFGKEPTKDASDLNGLPYLSAGSTAQSPDSNYRYVIRVDNLPLFTRPLIAARSIRRPLRLPALILHRALRNFRPCVALIEPLDGRDRIVLHRYYGISLASAPTYLGQRLNAILNSELVAYMAFFLGSSVGWERDVIEPQDWLELPMPPSILQEDNEEAWETVLDREEWLRANRTSESVSSEQNHIQQIRLEIEEQISQLYELSDQENVLIADTLNYTITPFLRGNESRTQAILARPTSAQLSKLCVSPM